MSPLYFYGLSEDRSAGTTGGLRGFEDHPLVWLTGAGWAAATSPLTRRPELSATNLAAHDATARGAAAAFPARGSLASNSRGSVGRGSAIGGIGGLGVETSPRRDAEMLVLREQKEAIQKRIEALEAGRETGAR